MEKSVFSNLFLMNEDIATCPTCGSRSDIILDLSHTQSSTQVHQCLAPECKMEFVLVYDSDFSKNNFYEKRAKTLDKR